MLVIYEGYHEVLVCEMSKEAQLIQEYFTEGGRDLEEYDRSTSNDILAITSNLKVE